MVQGLAGKYRENCTFLPGARKSKDQNIKTGLLKMRGDLRQTSKDEQNLVAGDLEIEHSKQVSTIN